MKSRETTLRAVALVAAFCLWNALAISSRAAAQQPLTIHVVDDPRPLAAAVLQIQEYFGVVVTYEDTLYAHANDLTDLNKGKPGSPQILTMRNGEIAVTEASGSGTVEHRVERLLDDVLARWHAAGNPGRFRVDKAPGGGGFNVVPVAAKRKTGVMEDYVSPLDTRVTIAPTSATTPEALSLLARAVTVQTGRSMLVAAVSPNSLTRTRVAVSADNERARDVLWRMLQSAAPNLSWRLLGDPEPAGGTCVLNVRAVAKKQ